ncbi:hypothetical protein LMG8520_2335 [Lactococcus lactis subsp. lactis]|uniref:Uncharacterized protein n=2 Tax=Lactococcus lactis TaxID=1358 RepID=A0A2A5SA66_LACLH|nr:hypothetical protein [Lactococcus lactis]KSU05884.1 hypothetical protein LMG8520_2335 [Lactococcus lactis subsp. lactis]PCS10389.1 hypothetical protein RU90_GL001310 [Lactococcus lactis subsp. hordniae]
MKQEPLGNKKVLVVGPGFNRMDKKILEGMNKLAKEAGLNEIKLEETKTSNKKATN